MTQRVRLSRSLRKERMAADRCTCSSPVRCLASSILRAFSCLRFMEDDPVSPISFLEQVLWCLTASRGLELCTMADGGEFTTWGPLARKKMLDPDPKLAVVTS